MMVVPSLQQDSLGASNSASLDEEEDPNDETAFLEEDLMAAMNAALEEDGSVSNHNFHGSETSSLRSVDVMSEAMGLLLSDTAKTTVTIDDDDVEEIQFDDFSIQPDLEDTKTKGTSNNNNNNNSPTCVVERDENDVASEPPKALENEEPQMVPLKQFENALALIQDLENRIQVLETDRQCLLEENHALKEETNKQATVLANMEEKLAEFPKLLETTVQEESNLAAAKAEAETKISFWRKDMARQEREQEEEKRNKNRAMVTTDSLKQADFLKDAVERKEKAPQRTMEGEPRRSGIFSALRGWRNPKRNSNHHNPNEKETQNDDDDDDDREDALELKTSGSGDSAQRKSHRPSILDEDDLNETNHEIADNRDDDKVLDLMT